MCGVIVAWENANNNEDVLEDVPKRSGKLGTRTIQGLKDIARKEDAQNSRLLLASATSISSSLSPSCIHSIKSLSSSSVSGQSPTKSSIASLSSAESTVALTIDIEGPKDSA